MSKYVNVEYVKITDVKSNPENPRTIKDEKYKQLVKSIESFPKMLELRPLVIDENNVVLGGNMRLKALQELKYVEIPIVRAQELSEEQKKEFIIKDNVGYGEWDWDILKEEWETEKLDEWGLEFPEFETINETEELNAQEDDFEVPDEDQIKTDIVLGDLIEIGQHRLLCGDSTQIDQVEKVMNGEKADMVFTDPPYGINVVQNEKVGADFGIAKKGKYSKIIADDTINTASEFYQTCIAIGFDSFILWGGNYFTSFLPQSDGWLIWNKRAGTDIRNTFADGEMAWCSFHTPIRIYDQLWNGMIRSGEKEKRVHPTQKPIKMLSEIIKDHIEGDLIFDGFLGSGSIMVASHQLNRKCYGIELDPKYCQVIVDRMRKLDPSLSIKVNGKIWEQNQ